MFLDGGKSWAYDINGEQYATTFSSNGYKKELPKGIKVKTTHIIKNTGSQLTKFSAIKLELHFAKPTDAYGEAGELIFTDVFIKREEARQAPQTQQAQQVQTQAKPAVIAPQPGCVGQDALNGLLGKVYTEALQIKHCENTSSTPVGMIIGYAPLAKYTYKIFGLINWLEGGKGMSNIVFAITTAQIITDVLEIPPLTAGQELIVSDDNLRGTFIDNGKYVVDMIAIFPKGKYTGAIKAWRQNEKGKFVEIPVNGITYEEYIP
jgi:hypothetical protein